MGMRNLREICLIFVLLTFMFRENEGYETTEQDPPKLEHPVPMSPVPRDVTGRSIMLSALQENGDKPLEQVTTTAVFPDPEVLQLPREYAPPAKAKHRIQAKSKSSHYHHALDPTEVGVEGESITDELYIQDDKDDDTNLPTDSSQAEVGETQNLGRRTRSQNDTFVDNNEANIVHVSTKEQIVRVEILKHFPEWDGFYVDGDNNRVDCEIHVEEVHPDDATLKAKFKHFGEDFDIEGYVETNGSIIMDPVGAPKGRKSRCGCWHLEGDITYSTNKEILVFGGDIAEDDTETFVLKPKNITQDTTVEDYESSVDLENLPWIILAVLLLIVGTSILLYFVFA